MPERPEAEHANRNDPGWLSAEGGRLPNKLSAALRAWRDLDQRSREGVLQGIGYDASNHESYAAEEREQGLDDTADEWERTARALRTALTLLRVAAGEP